MSELVPITDAEQLTLNLFHMLGSDPAAVKMAKDFIGTSALNYQLFQMSVSEVVSQPPSEPSSSSLVWVSVAQKALSLAEHKLTAFN